MLKDSILWLHKWLGIVTGLVVLVLSLTGAIYTFQDELKLYFYPEKYFFKADQSAGGFKPLTELINMAAARLPVDESISRVDIYPSSGRSWIFRAVETDENALGYGDYFRYHKRVFVNPQTGEVLAVENTKYEFFQLVLQTHMNLLLGKKYGHAVVGYSTAIFAVLLLSGMVLWWPKKWKGKALKRSVWLDRKAKWKRFIYDLHNVGGFYSFGIALILCITGLVFSFPVFKKGYTDFFNFMTQVEKVKSATPEAYGAVAAVYTDPLDNVVRHALDSYPNAGVMSVRLRGNDSEQVDVQIRMEEGRSGLFKWYYVNRENLQIDKVRSSDKLSGGDHLAALNFDIHTGNIGGLPTKILVFCIALLCGSLPITGYIVWWNKARKKPKNNMKVKNKAQDVKGNIRKIYLQK